jgi:FkbM family methyltransferase
MSINLHTIPLLRRLLLPLFARYNIGDIYIKHHYTGAQFALHSFKHKTYWYHGIKREQESMALFGKLIEKGNTIIEVGGHIGYVSLYLSSIVGDAGHVYVFEPGINNLPYIKKNVQQVSNVSVIPKAVSNVSGSLPFYIENITGMNNTLLKNYSFGTRNAANSFLKAEYHESLVDVTTIDTFIHEHDILPEFIKIDVEGAELDVLRGMSSCLLICKPLLMVEVTKHQTGVGELLMDNGYLICDTHLKIVRKVSEMQGNMFCLHEVAHARFLRSLGISNITNSET